MNIFEVPLEKISVDKSVDNRGSNDEIVRESSFGALLQSIKSIGLIHPIIINESSPPGKDEEFGKYVVVSGTRRFLAFRILFQDSKLVKFFKIPADIRKLTQQEANIIKSHENKIRANLSVMEDFEFKVSSIPFIFNIGVDGDKNHNFKKGMSILTVFTSLNSLYSKKSSDDKITLKIDELKEVTSFPNPVASLKEYFRQLGESPSYFWKKRHIFNYTKEVYDLYCNRRISFNAAKILNLCVSEKSKGSTALIREIKNNLNLTSHQISTKAQALLDESEHEILILDEEIIKKNKKTVRYINKMLKSTQGKMTMKNMNDIDSHFEQITKILKGIL